MIDLYIYGFTYQDQQLAQTCKSLPSLLQNC